MLTFNSKGSLDMIGGKGKLYRRMNISLAIVLLCSCFLATPLLFRNKFGYIAFDIATVGVVISTILHLRYRYIVWRFWKHITGTTQSDHFGGQSRSSEREATVMTPKTFLKYPQNAREARKSKRQRMFSRKMG